MNTYNMKHVKLFENFIAEFNSPYVNDEVKDANKFVAKETGLKNADSKQYPSLLVANVPMGKMRMLFTKSVNDRPASEDNIEVYSIDNVGIIRIMKAEDLKLMRAWGRKWGFKIAKSEEIYAEKTILVKDVREMIEEFTDILIQAFGDRIELAF